MEKIELTAGPDASGRLDAWLAGQCAELSRSALQNLMEQGRVTRGGSCVNKKDKVVPGAAYCIDLPEPQPIEAQPQNIPLDVVYEDNDLIVINKPKGMVVHPAPGNPDGTLVNALLYHCAGQLSGIGGAIRPASSTVSIRAPAACWSWPKTMPRTRRSAPSSVCIASTGSTMPSSTAI